MIEKLLVEGFAIRNSSALSAWNREWTTIQHRTAGRETPGAPGESKAKLTQILSLLAIPSNEQFLVFNAAKHFWGLSSRSSKPAAAQYFLFNVYLSVRSLHREICIHGCHADFLLIGDAGVSKWWTNVHHVKTLGHPNMPFLLLFTPMLTCLVLKVYVICFTQILGDTS